MELAASTNNQHGSYEHDRYSRRSRHEVAQRWSGLFSHSAANAVAQLKS
jgi:hypothetical protein